MPTRKETREAISALLDAQKTPTEIANTLQCSRPLVYKVKKLKAGGKNMSHAFSARKKTVLTPITRAAIRRRIRSAPTKSLRRVAKESGINREAVRTVMVQEGWRSLRRVKVPLISAQGQLRRRERALGLLNSLKRGGVPGRIIFYSDEKNFVIDPAYNAQNDRWIRFCDHDDDACLLYTSPSPRDS